MKLYCVDAFYKHYLYAKNKKQAKKRALEEMTKLLSKKKISALNCVQIPERIKG